MLHDRADPAQNLINSGIPRRSARHCHHLRRGASERSGARGEKIDEVRVVFSGAGAAAIACADHYRRLGMKYEQIIMCDEHGVIYEGREGGMNFYVAPYATRESARSLAEALRGADVFVGLSVGGVVTAEMLRSMAGRPIIFAMANPTPEISYPEAKSARPDAIVATGRSDFPNQVNNV